MHKVRTDLPETIPGSFVHLVWALDSFWFSSYLAQLLPLPPILAVCCLPTGKRVTCSNLSFLLHCLLAVSKHFSIWTFCRIYAKYAYRQPTQLYSSLSCPSGRYNDLYRYALSVESGYFLIEASIDCQVDISKERVVFVYKENDELSVRCSKPIIWMSCPLC